MDLEQLKYMIIDFPIELISEAPQLFVIMGTGIGLAVIAETYQRDPPGLPKISVVQRGYLNPSQATLSSGDFNYDRRREAYLNYSGKTYLIAYDDKRLSLHETLPENLKINSAADFWELKFSCEDLSGDSLPETYIHYEGKSYSLEVDEGGKPAIKSLTDKL